MLSFEIKSGSGSNGQHGSDGLQGKDGVNAPNGEKLMWNGKHGMERNHECDRFTSVSFHILYIRRCWINFQNFS